MEEIVLYQFPGAYGLKSLSPFCTKLEAYLRLAGVPYRAALGDPRKAPTGKLPYVRWDGVLLGDSGAIVDRCKAELGDPLDGGLDERARAVGHLARRAAEEHLYWGVLAVRWADERTWRESYRGAIAACLPAMVRWFLPGLLRRGVVKSLRAHGLGRHGSEELVHRCVRDLDSLAAVMGGRPFLLGDAPTSYDCAVYAMIEHLRRTPSEHPLAVAAAAHEALGPYCERMNERLAWD